MLDISSLDKDGLADYARTVFKTELDMRKNLESLRKDVKAMQDKPAKADELPLKKASHIKNKANGRVFPYTQLLIAHLGDNAIPCDENGEPA